MGSRASFCEQSAHTWHAWKRWEPEAGFSLPHWMQSIVARSWSRMGCWPFLGLRIDLLCASAAALAPEMLQLRGWFSHGGAQWLCGLGWSALDWQKTCPLGVGRRLVKKGIRAAFPVQGFDQFRDQSAQFAGGHGRAGAESAGTGKEVDCFHGAPEKTKPARLGASGLG